jgi:hypothetical protein
VRQWVEAARDAAVQAHPSNTRPSSSPLQHPPPPPLPRHIYVCAAGAGLQQPGVAR